MNRFAKVLISAAVALMPMAAIAVDGLQISHMSATNSIVKVDSADYRYLLIPIEEAMPDARIQVLVNGDLKTTFYARLAANKVDYYVPFDLTPYTSQGKVAFNILLPDDRAYSRNTAENLVWTDLRLSNEFSTVNREKYRPAYHFTPAYGWMNDPNGMFYKDGRWHLYFQHNPYGSKWQNMTWGHASSTDLANWEQHPNAILPTGLGAVFSGSSVVDTANTAGFGKDAVIALYTSAGDSQIQSMAYSTDDGMTFTNYPGNPVITTMGEARDPNMFWYEPTQRWILILAHSLDKEMLIYSSPDLKEWTLESAFGKGYGQQEGVWECPDLMRLPIRGTDREKWVLICNINPGGPFGGSAAQYFVGEFDGHKFTPDTAPEVTKWMDWGKDHYAAVSFANAPEGRHTTVAWMSNWEYANEVPTMQYRSAMALPRDHELFIGADGETYLASMPAKEIDNLRGKMSHYGRQGLGSKETAYPLPTANDGICEIVASLDLGSAKVVLITLSNPAGEHVEMVYNVENQTFTVDRSESGLTGFSNHFSTPVTAPTLHKDSRVTLRMFIDRSSLEVFDAQGRFALTNLVYPTQPYTQVSFKAVGGKASLRDLNVYEIKTSDNQE